MSISINHNCGFFSCCSMRLDSIINYINTHAKLPDKVDTYNTYAMYKTDIDKDITFEYYVHYDNFLNDRIILNTPINYTEDHQYKIYSELDYKNIVPVVKRYFSPSKNITDIIANMEQKYNLIYENICVLFYRGNDKITETIIPDYNEYVDYADTIIKNNPNIIFLVQSDETDFIEFITEKYPNNSFYFNDEIRHIKKENTSVDIVMKDQNNIFSKYFLAITIIMSKCKYIVCGSGNCSIWITFYRENAENVFQLCPLKKLW